LHVFPVQGNVVWTVVFSPDGKRLATASSDGSARLWDLTTKNERFVLKHSNPVKRVAFSPDGKRLAAGAEGELKLWDAVTGQELGSFKGHTATIYSINFSPDGATLATAGKDETARLWEVRKISPNLAALRK
jgi:WD40 repeat protein